MKTTIRGTLLIALLALLAAGCGGPRENPDLQLGGLDTSEVLKGLLARTNRVLGSVRDMATAQKAAQELVAINDDFDDLLYHVPKLSEKGRADLAKEARKALPSLRQTVDQIQGSPPLRDVLGPGMNTMLEKLGQLMQ